MENMKPKLFSVMKNYNGSQFVKDMMAGIIVAIIALPLSIAFALGCGVSAEKGIYSAIISSILIALLGGSRVQINGPTGAFIVITQSILTQYGMNGMMIAMILAGGILILMGLFKMGKLIKYIPAPITIGFTGGIAVTIFTLEVKDFLGLDTAVMPGGFVGKWKYYLTSLPEADLTAVILGLLSVVILVVWPKINKVIPNSLVALVIGTLTAYVLKLDVRTLGEINQKLTVPKISMVSADDFISLFAPAFTIAVLVAMQALLSAVVTDEIINSKHNGSMELIAQGIANAVLGLLGCIPATGGVARSIANAKNGGRTPVAAIFHGVTLFFFLMVCMPLVKFVPLCVLAAILLVVSVKMFNLPAFLAYRKAPKSDLAVLLTACILTFAFDLVFAIEVGIVLSCVLLMKRMSDVANISAWRYDDPSEENDPDALNLKTVPDKTLVFEISGPMFFGATDKLLALKEALKEDTRVVILRMRSVPAIDVTAMNVLKQMHEKMKENGITILFSHTDSQPIAAMKKSGFYQMVGNENFCPNIDAALKRAGELTA